MAIGIMLLVGAAIFMSYRFFFSEKTAATVDDEVITVAQLDAEIDKVLAQRPDIFDSEKGSITEAGGRLMILNELIDRVLLAQGAEKIGVAITDEEVAEQVEGIKSAYPDEDAFKESLTQAGATFEVFESQIRHELLAKKVREALTPVSTITDEDARAYFVENREYYEAQGIQSYEEISLTIETILLNLQRDKEFERFLDELRSNATIEILDPIITAHQEDH